MPIIISELPKLNALSGEALEQWNRWVLERPDNIRAMCESHPPWFYYDVISTKQVAIILAYYEDDTLRVRIVGDRVSVPTITPFEVFGIPRSDLVKRQK